jgi:hypothetical protein
LLSLLLNLVLSVENVMLPIEDLMVDGGCIATTGGRRLFCIESIWSYNGAPQAVWPHGASYKLREKKLPSLASWPAPTNLGALSPSERTSLPLIEMRHGRERGRTGTAGHVPACPLSLLFYFTGSLYKGSLILSPPEKVTIPEYAEDML